MFGSPVSLNFTDKGSKINTYCGSVLSILIKLFMVWYLFDRSIVLFGKKDNSYEY